MRIGLISDCTKPGVNGIIRQMSLLKDTLQKWGHDVLIFSWGRAALDDEAEVIRSPGFPFFKPGYHVGFGHSAKARDAMRTMDVLHAHQPLLSGLMAVVYGRRYRIPVVLTCHSRYDLIGVTRLPFIPLSVYRAFLKPVLRGVTDRCDGVTAPGAEAARIMRGLGVRRPIKIIPPGVALSPNRPLKTDPTRHDLGLPPRPVPVAVYLGRLDPEKNLRFILEALTRPELRKAHLLVVGDGSERARLQDYARARQMDARVRFRGEVAFDDVHPLLALSDFFVTASRIEMLPLTVLEALAAGLPILGLDAPWLRDVIRPGVNGFLSPDRVSSFARHWASLAEDKALRERLRAGAREMRSRYDIRSTAKLYLDLYKGLISRRSGSSGPEAQ